MKDKIVLITGAASGIGKAAAKAFAARGARLALADINEAQGQAFVDELKASGAEAFFQAMDVANYEAVKAFVSQTVTTYGGLDIALNNAGIGSISNQLQRTEAFQLEDWDRVIAVNQTGVFYCMKEELQVMSKAQKGAIINMASIAGLRAMPNQIAYTASKHAVVGMTKTAALEYARSGIRVNAVCPVFTSTPLVDQLISMGEHIEQKLLRSIPVGRFGEVADIVNAILWLSEDSSSFVTGLALPVDGGQMA